MSFKSTTRTVKHLHRSKKVGGDHGMSRGWKTSLMFCLLLMSSLLDRQPLRAEGVGQAATSISYDAQTRIFRISAADVSYIFGINERQQLQSIYWGQRL